MKKKLMGESINILSVFGEEENNFLKKLDDFKIWYSDFCVYVLDWNNLKFGFVDNNNKFECLCY